MKTETAVLLRNNKQVLMVEPYTILNENLDYKAPLNDLYDWLVSGSIAGRAYQKMARTLYIQWRLHIRCCAPINFQ